MDTLLLTGHPKQYATNTEKLPAVLNMAGAAGKMITANVPIAQILGVNKFALIDETRFHYLGCITSSKNIGYIRKWYNIHRHTHSHTLCCIACIFSPPLSTVGLNCMEGCTDSL